MPVNEHDCVPVKLCLQMQVGQLWPMGRDLPAPSLAQVLVIDLNKQRAQSRFAGLLLNWARPFARRQMAGVPSEAGSHVLASRDAVPLTLLSDS